LCGNDTEYTIPAEPKLRSELAKQLCAEYGGNYTVLSRYFAKPLDGRIYAQFKFKAPATVTSCTDHRHLFDPVGLALVMKVPALQRKQLREHMWKSYSDLHGTTGISRSEYIEAVNISTATQQKSLAALDNISVRYGTENFKSMCSIINALAEKATGLGQLAAQLRAKIQRLEAHLKSSLQDHLLPTSTCAAHCITCLLGGQNEFSNKCGASCNNHPDHCEMCDAGIMLIHEMRAMLQQVSGSMDAEKVEDYTFLIKRCEVYLKVYHSHQVRGFWEAREKAGFISLLNSHNLMITVDWKQKWIIVAP